MIFGAARSFTIPAWLAAAIKVKKAMSFGAR